MVTPHEAATFIIAALATGCVVVRPWRMPEAVWALAGAAALVGFGLLPWTDAVAGIRKGLDVYLFLTGMMLLAELARREGLFDWLAALAVEHSRGSPQRLFSLVYAVGIVVTVFLSNDATAVVLTPAVYAAARAAGALPLPYLFVCAFVANAASFVLPISNPANLVIFASRMPPLGAWLRQFLLPSVLAVGATYLLLRFSQRAALRGQRIAAAAARPELKSAGCLTAAGIACTAVVLLVCSALDLQLGLPTFAAGCLTTAAVLAIVRQSPLPLLGGISWGVLPLVAGLFVLIEGLARAGVDEALHREMQAVASYSAAGGAWLAAATIALACNLMNNLPAGLIAGTALASDRLPDVVKGAVLVGVDLGPNLSVTGSLATILWLIAIRRERQDVSAWQFLKLGAVVMPPALILAMAALVMVR